MAADNRPSTGDWTPERISGLLTLLGALAFYGLFIILPLVGPSAAHGSGSPGATQAPHYARNVLAFSLMLLLTLGLSGTALYMRLAVRRTRGGPFPRFQTGMVALGVIMLLMLLTGAFTW